MKKKTLILPLIALMGAVSLAGCGGGGDSGTSGKTSRPTSAPTSKPTSAPSVPSSSTGIVPTSAPTSAPSGATSDPTSGSLPEQYSITAYLASGKLTLQVGDEDEIVVVPSGTPEKTPVYKYAVVPQGYISVTAKGHIDADKAGGPVRIRVFDSANNVEHIIEGINVIDKADPADGGFNYAAKTIEEKTEILGQLEKYAMDSHLTGITLFENGGYVKYSDRVELPTTQYITGYGFGILSEGQLLKEMANEENPKHKMYLHSATSSDPYRIDDIDNTGSQVSDLASYITSSYWGTKMNSAKTGYEWYPILAKDTIDGKPFNRPIPAEEENAAGLYKRWRIYVKTGADGNLKYSTLSNALKSYDGRGVELADYEFKYQALLTGANKIQRGIEMANDTSYGIKGALQYYNRTKGATEQSFIDATWNQMKEDGSLGIATGSDSKGSYIEIEIINPVDAFTAMYTLSSNLVSPLPRTFIESLGSGSVIDGMKAYGKPGSGKIIDHTLCLGAYTLEDWTRDQAIVFKRNDSWFERTTYPNRYRIAGVKMRVVTNATENPEAIYNEFSNGNLDSCGIPTSKIADEKGQPYVYPTKGDSTFKLNVNSCDQATWDDLFGENGKVSPGSTYPYNGGKVRPWMSNDDFLQGLFYSINRKEFADKRGVQPSINYFSDSYLSDPENGVSYNSTKAHKDAVAAYQVEVGGEDQYGYSKDIAIEHFKRAIATLKAEGSVKDGDTIHIHIMWMYKSDEVEYGEDIIKYFEDAFNNNQVSGGKIKLKVDQGSVTNWEDVYNEYLMKGQFDLGFGAISGNTYNPLNFLEVLKSDNSSGFTLNWGADTSKIDSKSPIIYDGRSWSFDALWNAADHGGVVKQGEIVKSVKHAYLEMPKLIKGGAATNDLLPGVTIKLPLEFVEAEGAEFTVNGVQIYIPGAGNVAIPYTLSSDGKALELTINDTLASEINEKIRVAFKLREEDKNPNPVDDAFLLGKYDEYWTVEVNYLLSINKGSPTQNYIGVAKDKDHWDPNK